MKVQALDAQREHESQSPLFHKRQHIRIVYPPLWARSALALFVSGVLSSTITHAHLPVQVRGGSQLDADVQIAASGSHAVVRGSLRDELGEPLAAMNVKIELADSTAVSTPLKLEPCRRYAVGVATNPELIDTKADGQFCANIPLEQLPTNAKLRVAFEGSINYVSTSLMLALDDLRIGLNLEIPSSHLRINLDRADWELTATLSPLTPDASQDSAPLPLEISLLAVENEKAEPQTLQRAQMRVGVPAAIKVLTGSLRSPGPGRIRFTFDGSSKYKPFRRIVPIERTVSVRLRTVDWSGRVSAGTRMAAQILADSAFGPPPTGYVEVLAFGGGSRLFPISPDGSASISIPAPRRQGHAVVSLRFQSSARGWSSTPALQLPLEIVAPSKWMPVGWAALALLVFGWFAYSRRRVELGAGVTNPPLVPKPYAHIEMLEAAGDAEAGWSGVIVDAHDADPIGGATVELRLAAFGGEQTLFSTKSDGSGLFEIPAQTADKQTSLRLEIHARGYARLDLQLPSPGRVKVFLISVRRAVLERFISWTKRRGPPYVSAVEPTPDWVANVAQVKGQSEVENWAKAVAEAAFGQHAPADIDAPKLLPPAGTIGAPAGAKRTRALSNG